MDRDIPVHKKLICSPTTPVTKLITIYYHVNGVILLLLFISSAGTAVGISDSDKSISNN